MNQAVYADRFFLPSGVVGPGYLQIEAGKFGEFSKERPEVSQVIDCSGKWIAPGLVDTHIHGFRGKDVMDNDAEGLKVMSEGLLSCGVTSFLPTTLTADETLLSQVSQTIGGAYQEMPGAKIQGIYFEGPFFTEEHKGAQNPKYFMNPSPELLEKWQHLSGGLIRKIAIAPEREGVSAFVQRANELGIVTALGHSSATYQEAVDAVNAGASVFVHTYNGMSGLSHREPGMVGAALTTDTFAELICDGHHVHPAAADLVMKAKGHDKVALITDCMRAGGMPDGEYLLGELPVIVKDGAARLKEGGSLAGSVLQLFDGVKNVIAWNIASAKEAIRMATIVPAKSCRIDHVCGAIERGKDADFIVMTPQMELEATYLDGVCRYTKGG